MNGRSHKERRTHNLEGIDEGLIAIELGNLTTGSGKKLYLFS